MLHFGTHTHGRFWSTLGIRSAALKTSAEADVAKYRANTASRTRPALRLSRMPAPTRRADPPAVLGVPTGGLIGVFSRRKLRW